MNKNYAFCLVIFTLCCLVLSCVSVGTPEAPVYDMATTIKYSSVPSDKEGELIL